jgi:predicted SprT family Zn-dependent metalloprotease
MADQLTLDFTTAAPEPTALLDLISVPEPPPLTFHELERQARAAMREHGLTAQGWTFAWDNARSRLGLTNFGNKRITLSRPIFTHQANRDAEGLDTILHEIAHVLAGPAHGHDAVWKATARRIGAKPRRCAPGLAVKPDAPWAGACGCGDEKHARHQKPAPGRTWTCRICRQQVRWWKR